MSIFEQATKMKLRFPTMLKGSLSVEDLWDLPLVSKARSNPLDLDSVAKSVNKELKESEEESFVATRSQKNEVLVLKMAVVKRIIEVKLAERAAKEVSAEKADRREVLKLLITQKEASALGEKSIEELKKELAET